MTWVNSLKQIMNDKGVNIESLKNKILENGHQLSRNSIGNILNERNSPKMETIQIIANALDVDMFEIFRDSKTKNNALQNEPDGFIDLGGTIYRIKSKEEFKELYSKIFEVENVADREEKPVKAVQKQSFIQGSLLLRAKTKQNINKLQHHVYQRYHVTLSNKRELDTSNNIPRDAKIWVFRSEREENKARSIVQNTLNFRFNA